MVYPVAPRSGRRWLRVLVGLLILSAALGVLGFLVIEKMNNQMAAKPMQLDAAPVAVEAPGDATVAEATDDASVETAAGSAAPSDGGTEAATEDAGVVADVAVDAGAPVAEKTAKPARPKVNKPKPRPRPKQPKPDKPEGDKPPDLDSPFPD